MTTRSSHGVYAVVAASVRRAMHVDATAEDGRECKPNTQQCNFNLIWKVLWLNFVVVATVLRLEYKFTIGVAVSQALT